MIVAREVQAAFEESLRDLDVAKARRCWAHVFPQIPPPATDRDALVMLHMSRTQRPVVSERERFRSHRWLIDHGYPSLLPDRLKPRAERIDPVKALGVGISVNMGATLKPLAAKVAEAMSDAVLEAQADGRLEDAAHVSARMAEAKRKTIRRLLGR